MAHRGSIVMLSRTALYAEEVVVELVEERILTLRELKEAFR